MIDPNPTAPTLAYADRSTRPPRRSRPIVVALNVVSLLVSLFFLADIGDGYAPLVAMLLGLPHTLATATLASLPAVSYGHADRNGRLTLLGLVSLAAATGSVALCYLMPHTHGGTC